MPKTKGYIQLENWWVRKEFKHIKTRAGMLVYAVLRTYRNRKTCECYPSMETLMDVTGLCRKAISGAIRHLEELGLVEVKQEKWIDTQRWANNRYVVRDEESLDTAIRPSHTKNRVPKTDTRPVYPKEVHGQAQTPCTQNGDIEPDVV